MVASLRWIEASSGAVASAPSFGGLGMGGLITVIVVFVILIVVVVWLINGTKRRD
jgi:uncharacterized membrane-anchored protein